MLNSIASAIFWRPPALAKLLLADDDESLVANIADCLKSSDYHVDLTYSADETTSMIGAYEYDLIILDWEFPDGAGIDIVSSFRGKGGLTPILLLTGKSSIKDKEKGLDAGADDYLTKPFHMAELQARVRALLRRPRFLAGEELKVGDIKLNTASRRVYLGAEEIKLQPMEVSVLEFFMRNPGKPYSPEKIIERVWETTTDVSLQAVYSCIKRLRRKLDRPGSASVFRTVPGAGYELFSG
jgi:DNA-binding response OmpR family regulator